MDVAATLPAFVLAVLLMSASPGPAMVLILRRASLRGFRSAVATVLGLEAGLYAWALMAAAGFAALVAASEVAYVVLRVVGAAVLIGLGLRAWRAAWRSRADRPDRPLFATTALLALLQVAIETALYLSLAAGFARTGAWFRRPAVRRRVEAVTGTVLLGLGLRVAVSSR